MNFTRWSARLPKAARRRAARAATQAAQPRRPSGSESESGPAVPAARGKRGGAGGTDSGVEAAEGDGQDVGRSPAGENATISDTSISDTTTSGHATSDTSMSDVALRDFAGGPELANAPTAPNSPDAPSGPRRGASSPSGPDHSAPGPHATAPGPPGNAPDIPRSRSAEAAPADPDRSGPDLSDPDVPTTHAFSADIRGTDTPDAGRPPSVPAEGVLSGIDALPVDGLLGQVPALAAVVCGAEHRIAYVNDAWARVFGPRPVDAPARTALPEAEELGLLPLLDQVLRSGRPRSVKSRRVEGRGRAGYYTFTCTPITSDEYAGVLIFGTDVTDQVEAAERLRSSERRQREAAVTLQRSLLPQELEQPDDLRVAATYQPGSTDAAVGGDWYDVITLGAGRTALVIGDVMGRGVRAAAVMGQLRTAVRAYARLDLPPHEVLQLLDGLASEIDPSQIATCVYAVHDPSEGCLNYASAGHLPILVRDSEGTVRATPEPTGPPLGTGGWQHTSGSVPLEPGSTALLYTDGLVERRDADIDEGITELERAFAGATGQPQVTCDRMLRAMRITAEHDDDVAVLVLQHPERSSAEAELFRGASLDLLGGTEAAPRARAFASGVLTSWRFTTELHDQGVLAASELVANSLQHGTPPMRLRLHRTDRRLTVEVTDGDDHLPRRRQPEPVDEAGRGISIVATIASNWGSRRTPSGGKAVWCEFVLPAD